MLVRGDGSYGHSALHQIDGVIGQATIAHFAFLDERLHGCPGFFDRSIGIRVVELIEIDVVGLQIAQARFNFSPYACRCEVFAVTTILIPDGAALRKNIDAIALSS